MWGSARHAAVVRSSKQPGRTAERLSGVRAAPKQLEMARMENRSAEDFQPAMMVVWASPARSSAAGSKRIG